MLYFGDHPYSDLADVTLEHGWRTGAIISELTVIALYVCAFSHDLILVGIFFSMKEVYIWYITFKCYI